MVRRAGIAAKDIDDAVIVDDMVRRVVGRLSDDNLAIVLNEMAFFEAKRLRRSKDSGDQAYLAQVRRLQRSLGRADDAQLQEALGQMAQIYTEEIHGHFDLKTYGRVTQALPQGLKLLLSGRSPWKMLRKGLGDVQLGDKITLSGQVDTFDKLVDKGTCIMVPTHLSNLDSPVIGFCLHQANLPPLIYGAGINLFTNWLMSFFMDRLGAYKVDREKQFGLYKEVLKEYATMALERGWHSLFFPGGTRIRSGAVESRLKKGLLGTGIEAFRRNIEAGKPHPRVYFIPATINYHLVLEAETLIEDHLQSAGKARYIITDDEFSRPDRVLQFVRHMASLGEPIEVVVGEPLDPFGNRVDGDGNSLDPAGRPFDPAGYLMRNGQLPEDEQRDRVFTTRLAEEICRSYRQDTVLFDTNLVASALHRRLIAHNPGLDLYRRLLIPRELRGFSVDEVDAELKSMLAALTKLADQGLTRLGRAIDADDAAAVRASGLATLGRFHRSRAVAFEEDRLIMEDPRLALYYANRLQGLPLPKPLPVKVTQ